MIQVLVTRVLSKSAYVSKYKNKRLWSELNLLTEVYTFRMYCFGMHVTNKLFGYGLNESI